MILSHESIVFFHEKGDDNCGKTSLIHAYKERTFIKDYDPTIVKTDVVTINIDNGKKV